MFVFLQDRMSLSSAPTLLEPSKGDRKDELSLQEKFQTAIERLKGTVPRENQELHQPLQPLCAYLITTRAGPIYRHLACYHLWRIEKNEVSRGQLISSFAENTGVTKTTIQSQMNIKGSLVSAILIRLQPVEKTHSGEKTPWAIVIVLFMLIQPMIKSGTQDIVAFVEDLLQGYEDQKWQHPSFATDSVLDVIQIASGLRLKSNIRDRQSRVIPPPPEGGLYKLDLPNSLLHEGPGPNSEHE